MVLPNLWRITLTCGIHTVQSFRHDRTCSKIDSTLSRILTQNIAFVKQYTPLVDVFNVNIDKVDSVAAIPTGHTPLLASKLPHNAAGNVNSTHLSAANADIIPNYHLLEEN